MKISIIVKAKTIKKICVILFWVVLWEICSLLIGNVILMPSPFQVIKALVLLSGKAYFWNSILFSLLRVLEGIIISIVFGILLGIVSGLNNLVEIFLNPVVVLVKSTPIISVIIIALVWFSSSNVVVFTAVLICFPIVYTNVLEGIKNVDKQLMEMAHIYKVKKRYVIRYVYMPQLRSYIVSGIFMCLGIGWKVSVAAEVLSTPKYSIGINLLDSKSMLDIQDLFAWTAIVVILSFLFEKLFKMFLNKFKMHC